MSAFAAQNMMSVLIGKNINRAGTQYTNSLGSGYIADGEILCIGSDGSVVTAPTYSSHKKIRFVQRSGSTLRFTPWIQGSGIVSYKATDGTDATEQVYTLGYNGTSGSIDTGSTEAFKLSIEFTFDESMGSLQSFSPIVCTPYDVASPTQIGIATHFVEQINANANPSPGWGTDNPLVVANLLSAEAGAAIGAAADTVVGLKGTNTVVITDTAANSSITGLFVAGDYFRAGTATTDPVYKVESSTVAATGGVIILSTPLTADVNLLGTTAEIITAAQATAAAAGIKITAQELAWRKDFFKYMQVTFKVATSEFDTTTVTSTAPVRPKGNYKQVAELESFSKGFDGALNRTTIPLPDVQFDTATSGKYDMITIDFYDDSNYGAIAGPARMRQQVIIAVVDDGATPVANQMNEILDALDAWMATVPNAQSAQLTSVAG